MWRFELFKYKAKKDWTKKAPLQYSSVKYVLIRHSMSVTSTAIRHLNPGQALVITYDHPLLAIVKPIQWQWPDTYTKVCHSAR